MKYQYQHFNLYYDTLADLDVQLNKLGEQGWNLEILEKEWRNGVAVGQPKHVATVFGKRKTYLNEKLTNEH